MKGLITLNSQIRLFIIFTVLFAFFISTWANAGTVKLPRTGQTICYDYWGGVINCAGTGQDGEIQSGVAWPNPRFTDNGNGTVTDNLTGLMWLKDANCFGRMPWQSALDTIVDVNGNPTNYNCQDLTVQYTDWRLPNRNELRSLIDYSRINPSLPVNAPFLNVQPSSYWSATTFASNTGNAWIVSVWISVVGVPDKDNYSFYVWPVRSGQSGGVISLATTGQTTSYYQGDDGELQTGVSWPDPRFTVGTGAQVDCALDNLTGLMWAKNANLPNSRRNWQEALDYVASINSGVGLCGYTDWRLPNFNELASLINVEEPSSTTWLNGQGFTNVQPTEPHMISGGYWSSTYDPRYTYAACMVDMPRGYLGNDDKDMSYWVWPVRSDEEPILVELVYFNATPSSNTVILEWETDMEIDNAGFNIWRSEQENSGYGKINSFLIPAQGSGSVYNYTDDGVTNGTTYYYKLEDIDLYGLSTLHGPVSATPNEVVLLNPENNAVLSSGTPPSFEWASDSYTLFKLVFEGQKLRKYSTKGWTTDTSFTPSANEWGSFVGKLGEGQTVFWSVKGKDVEGNKAQSETRSFTVEE